MQITVELGPKTGKMLSLLSTNIDQLLKAGVLKAEVEEDDDEEEDETPKAKRGRKKKAPVKVEDEDDDSDDSDDESDEDESDDDDSDDESDEDESDDDSEDEDEDEDEDESEDDESEVISSEQLVKAKAALRAHQDKHGKDKTVKKLLKFAKTSNQIKKSDFTKFIKAMKP